MALGIMPGEHDWERIFGRDPYGRVPGVFGGMPQMPQMGGLAQLATNPAITLGLGLLAGRERGMGFGEGALGAVQGYQDVMDRSFRNTMLNRRFEREEREAERQQKAAERAERQTVATTAGRISSGIGQAQDPMAYWRLVQGMPEVTETLRAYGIDPASVTTPEQIQAIGEQLAAASQVGGPVAQTTNVQSTFVGKNGNLWIVNRDGTVRDTGTAVTKFAQRPVEVGGGVYSFDPASGGVTGQLSSPQTEIDAAARKAAATTAAKTEAEKTTEARLDLPRVEQNVSESVAVIDQLLEHEGLPYITGLYSKAPIVPNTSQAAASALAEQVQGQTFLQAYQTLKGGGQITEVEGRKAEAAIARLNRAQKTEDYQAALRDLRDVLTRGLERARKSGGGTAPADPLGIR